MIKGIRSHKKDEAAYISAAITDIKRELKSSDMSVKVDALKKATYLQMHGYDITWTAFNCVEVMSQPLFKCKRLGYYGATLSLARNNDVILLTTNLFKKDFGAMERYVLGQ